MTRRPRREDNFTKIKSLPRQRNGRSMAPEYLRSFGLFRSQTPDGRRRRSSCVDCSPSRDSSPSPGNLILSAIWIEFVT
jgi:hypothetical protein